MAMYALRWAFPYVAVSSQSEQEDEVRQPYDTSCAVVISGTKKPPPQHHEYEGAPTHRPDTPGPPPARQWQHLGSKQGIRCSDFVWEGRTLSLHCLMVPPEGEGAEGDRIGIPAPLSAVNNNPPQRTGRH